MSNDLECPVDNITVNESRVRLVAFFVLVLALICFITTNWIIVVFLLVDFTLRTFNLNSYSLLSLISGQLVKLFKLKNKPVDRAPKRFAAFIGLIFTAVITVTLLIDLSAIAKIALVVLMIFAALESLVGFCAGCYVYSYLKHFKLIK
jgi:hypothetical protein